MMNQVYPSVTAEIKQFPDLVCHQCGGPAQIADPFSAGDFFPCDCTMDRTPVLAPLNPGPVSWMEKYFLPVGEM